MAHVVMHFEVCGLETISKPYGDYFIYANYSRFNGTGYNFDVMMNTTNYKTNFTSSSRLCPARFFELYDY